MPSVAIHLPRVLLVTLVAGVLGLLSIAALSMQTQTRASVMAQLQRPAHQIKANGSEFSASARSALVRLNLTLAINRAGALDPARVSVLGVDGRPVGDAQVMLTYSMPSMNMWHVYSSRLEPDVSRAGSYSGTEAALGMAGRWRITVTVALRAGRTERFALSDQMPA
jgi:YtkA-like